MIPIRYFVVQSLKFVTCLLLGGALLFGFAVNYSYLSGGRQDRAEMNETLAQLLSKTDSIRIQR